MSYFHGFSDGLLMLTRRQILPGLIGVIEPSDNASIAILAEADCLDPCLAVAGARLHQLGGDLFDIIFCPSEIFSVCTRTNFMHNRLLAPVASTYPYSR